MPVVVDLWAPWCGPCKQLGPILEKVIGATGGRVELAKVNVDENPQVGQAFQVQSIPAVYAMKDGAVADHFIGAKGEPDVIAFVQRLLDGVPADGQADDSEVAEVSLPTDEAGLVAALESTPDDPALLTALATLLVDEGRTEEAEAILERTPESPETRHLMAIIRTSGQDLDNIEGQLEALLIEVKVDDDARQRFVDLLEVLGPDDPRTHSYRRRLATALF